ncbi:MAG TPA: hypothetical protein VGR66_10270 [Candidatus Eisenbacteria bacterium]|nr:hypothetical protein [Candidatus Eisenbacteria bacterium]
MGVAGEELSRGAIEWRSEPWRGSTAAIVLVALLFVALGTYAAAIARDWIWTGLVGVAAAYVLSPLTVPVHYRLDSQGITRRSWLSSKRLLWPRFAAWRLTPNRRIAVLRFAGKGPARWSGGMSLFLPEEPLREQVLGKLVGAIGAEGVAR